MLKFLAIPKFDKSRPRSSNQENMKIFSYSRQEKISNIYWGRDMASVAFKVQSCASNPIAALLILQMSMPFLKISPTSIYK